MILYFRRVFTVCTMILRFYFNTNTIFFFSYYRLSGRFSAFGELLTTGVRTALYVAWPVFLSNDYGSINRRLEYGKKLWFINAYWLFVLLIFRRAFIRKSDETNRLRELDGRGVIIFLIARQYVRDGISSWYRHYDNILYYSNEPNAGQSLFSS